MAKDEIKTGLRLVGTRPPRPDGLDKVTGRARYGADFSLPGMLFAAVVRSPHAHARIIKIDASKALALEGVKAVVTRDDLSKAELTGEDWALRENTLAGEVALYDGHAVAAVAATSALLAQDAAKLIHVEYEVLPHVIDVDDAIRMDAPAIRPGSGDHSVPEGAPPNVVKQFEFGHGDVEAGFAAADLVLERTYKTEATHQGYIEPHACVGQMGGDGRGEMWVCTQGHWYIRRMCAVVLGTEAANLRVTPSEIGGGFGGKTTIFMEPLALALSKKAGGRPVKLVMSRSEVLRATGPTASASMDVKLGMKKDGTMTAASATFRMQGGAFPGSPVDMALYCAFAPYQIPAIKHLGFDVLANRPKCAAYRAPGSPMGAFAVESLVNEMCDKLGLDPLEVRLKNAAKSGMKSSYGPKFGSIGLTEVLEATKAHPNLNAPLGPNQGRGIASGYWFNHGGETSVTVAVGEDGTATVSIGTPDIGGSRASIGLMVAETLGINYEDVRVNVVETGALGVNEPTHGSRATFASGKAAVVAAQEVISKLCARAAAEWSIDADAVEWVDGAAQPAGPNAGKFPPLSLAQIAAKMGGTGGPISGHHESVPEGVGASFGAHVVDVEVDPETGRTTILRYLVVQDAGRAIHPAYVEGQFQGGAAQGIGWALNEEYVYGKDGRLQNPMFLDYRVPVASDLPRIDTVIVEVPNPGHPYGVRGVGETGITPPLPAIASAVAQATGVRLTSLPLSPPKVLKAIKEAKLG